MIAGNYSDGRYEGSWTQWYDNGQKFLEGSYHDDMLTGKWIQWFQNGNKYFEGVYNKSDKDGP